MNIARILYPVEVLGPGKRIGLWLCGCDRACKGCSNPELWNQKPEFELSVNNIMRLIQSIATLNRVDGFTITGGEPMLQAKELLELIEHLKKISTDIIIYSGFELEALHGENDAAIEGILNSIAVLIDGAYMEQFNDNSVLRGSSNQNIHVLNLSYEEKYQNYLREMHNQIQNFLTVDGIISVGIHRRAF